MELPRRKFLHLASFAAALITVTSTTLAQDCPTRAVTMVVVGGGLVKLLVGGGVHAVDGIDVAPVVG